MDGVAQRGLWARRFVGVLTVLALSGCATQLEQRSRQDLQVVANERSTQTRATPGKPLSPPRIDDGSLAAYVRYGLDNSPALRARFEEWRAVTQRTRLARKLPEPVITYGYFIQRVETRVGPQRHRFGISQTFPWPTQLSANADAAGLAARSAQRGYEAEALKLTRLVAEAYWQLWLIHRTRAVLQDEKRLLEHFSSVVRGRLEVGQATLADVGQIDLGVSRLVDALESLDEKERRTSAALVAAIGAPPDTPTPVTDEQPPLILPSEDVDTLRAAVTSHPDLRSLSLLAQSKQHQARAAGADAYPSFTLGVDYIETGPTDMPNVADSGKDAVIAMVGATLPIWGGAYDAAEEEAQAESASLHARHAAAQDQAISALAEALSEVRDAARRVKLHRDTLVPQAETVYASGLGAYQVGQGTLAAVLIAERDLIDLQLSLVRARAKHAVAWARLEQIVGRSVPSKEAP